MAVSDVSAKHGHLIESALQPLHDVHGVDTARAHGPDDPDARGVLKPGNTRQVRTRVGTPVTQERQDFRFERIIHFFFLSLANKVHGPSRLPLPPPLRLRTRARAPTTCGLKPNGRSHEPEARIPTNSLHPRESPQGSAYHGSASCRWSSGDRTPRKSRIPCRRPKCSRRGIPCRAP